MKKVLLSSLLLLLSPTTPFTPPTPQPSPASTPNIRRSLSLPYSATSLPRRSGEDRNKERNVRVGLQDGNVKKLKVSSNASATTKKRTTKLTRKRSTAASFGSIYANSAVVPPSLLTFLSEVHDTTSLLSKDEEYELGMTVQKGRRYKRAKVDLEKELRRDPTVGEMIEVVGCGSEEEYDAVIKLGDEARRTLVECNLRLVQKVVNVYIRNGLGSQYNAGDMMQDGTMSLIKAAEKFDPTKGFRFSTYAMFWVRSSVKRSQLRQSTRIAVPVRVHERYKKIRTLRDEGVTNVDVVAEVVGVTPKVVSDVVEAMERKVFSLDAPIDYRSSSGGSSGAAGAGGGSSSVGSGGDNTFAKFVDGSGGGGSGIGATPTPSNDGNVLLDKMIETSDVVSLITTCLDDVSSKLIIMRYGLGDMKGDCVSVKELAGIAGMKQDKVRRIIKRGMGKIRPVFEEYVNS